MGSRGVGERQGPLRERRAAAALLALLGWLAAAPASHAELLFVSEGNNLRRIDLDSVDEPNLRHDVLIQHAARGEEADGQRPEPASRRRDLNGIACAFPDGSGRFVAGEDTGQPSPPPGWGVFSPEGVQIGKLTATYFVDQGEPYGCGFDAAGTLFTSELGNVGFGTPKGQLIRWFPPFVHFPGEPGAYPDTDAHSANFCKIAVDIGNASGLAIDEKGRVYVSSAGRGTIERFSPPFPSGPDAERGCGARDTSGAPLASEVQREVFYDGFKTFSGLAFAPNGNLYAASVFTGEIFEIDPNGELVRTLLEPDRLLPPFPTGNPMGIAVDARGDVYYADLDLQWDFPSISPGPNGKVRRIRFDERGEPRPPEILMDGLAFPDGVAVLPGSLPGAPAP